MIESWDFKEKIGFDNVITMTTGSAPIAPETIKFLKAAVNVGFAQGYGLSESFAGLWLLPNMKLNRLHVVPLVSPRNEN